MASPLYVDLNALPQRVDIGDRFDYAFFAEDLLGGIIPHWQRLGYIKDPRNGSWGGFVANPEFAGRYHLAPRNDPDRFIGTVFGYGTEWLRYALNAARMGILLAEMSREYHSTLDISSSIDRALLGESAESAVSARDLRWMPFPYGGAVLVGEGSKQRLWGISAFLEEEDDALIKLLAVLAQTTQGRLA